MAARKKKTRTRGTSYGKSHPNWRERGGNGRFAKQTPGGPPAFVGEGLGVAAGGVPMELDGASMPFTELGQTGLRHFSGIIDEEFLPALRGVRATQVYREMRDNDPTIGAMLFAIEMLMRKVEWRVEPGGDDPADLELAEFVDSCRGDMAETWHDTLASILSFLPFGFSVHEEVYKRRDGSNPLDLTRDSRFDDGRIGWRKLPVRAQDTVHRWIFDEDHGQELLGLVQLPPPRFQFHTIPESKFLLFRTTAAKGNPQGRALDPETPVATPRGFRPIGELATGDSIYDEAGRVRYVTATARWKDRPRYRMRFDTGDEIVADGLHDWPTTLLWERSKQRPERLRSTAEIAQTVKNSNGVTNHAIPLVSSPLDAPDAWLPVEPWALGLWLGDGISRSGDIATHAGDAVELSELLGKAGYPVDRIEDNGPGEGGLGRLLRVRGGFQRALRFAGVLGGKHVPETYLSGSPRQRAALLAGLLDSDGHVTRDGQIEFCNTNRRLIDAVYALAASLGEKPITTLRRREGPERSRTWAVRWTQSGTRLRFRLRRKAARIRTDPIRGRRHFIRSVERIEDGPTVCIETDAPSHLFLAGKSLVPSHNSVLRNAYRPWFFKRRIEEIEAIGVERDLAGLPKMEVPAEILASDAKPEEKALAAEIRKMLRDIRRDEREGILVPRAFDKEGNERYKFELVRSGGRRQFDTTAIVNRYDRLIASVVLADFILLGQQRVGSFALAESKTELFGVALGAWLDSIMEIFNRTAIPRLLLVNGFRVESPPQLKHGDVETIDLAELGDYIAKLTGAGMPLFPDPETENALRAAGGLPERPDDLDLRDDDPPPDPVPLRPPPPEPDE